MKILFEHGKGEHLHKFLRVSSDVPDYFQCECGKQVNEEEVVEYEELLKYLQLDMDEARATGNQYD